MYQHTLIGLDVHAASVVGCALVPETGEMVQAKMDSDPAVVLEWTRRFESPVRAVYESGPIGYVLARYLRQAGVDCVVAASSKLLQALAIRSKRTARRAGSDGNARPPMKLPITAAPTANITVPAEEPGLTYPRSRVVEAVMANQQILFSQWLRGRRALDDGEGRPPTRKLRRSADARIGHILSYGFDRISGEYSLNC